MLSEFSSQDSSRSCVPSSFRGSRIALASHAFAGARSQRSFQGVLTPDFDACQGGVLQRRKGSVWYDRWTWRGDRASP